MQQHLCDHGGGIFAGGCKTLIIEDTTFENNYGGFQAGALALAYQNVTLGEGVFFDGNSAMWGGAIAVVGGSEVTLDGCSLQNSLAQDAPDGEIFSSNYSERGAGVYNGGFLSSDFNLYRNNTKSDAPSTLYVKNRTVMKKSPTAAGYGTGVYQNGIMYLSGTPSWEQDTTIHLPKDRVITKDGDFTFTGKIPITLVNEMAGRNIVERQDSLAEKTAVLSTDLEKFDVRLADPEPATLAAIFTPTDAETARPVIELGIPAPVKKYTVTYDLNGGIGAGSVSYADAQVEENHTVTLPTAPTKAGSSFTGWSDGTTAYQPGDEVKITANITFTAQWEANSGPSTGTQYTLRYDSNGGTKYPDEHYSRDTTVKLTKYPSR